jgi:hypothetical protein
MRRLLPIALIIASAFAATTAPATKVFEDKKAGIHFIYPADWKPENGGTAIFEMESMPMDSKGYADLSLDTPSLPWHPAGFITPRMIAKGYLDDLRKHEIPDAKQLEMVDLTACGCKACRVKSVGHEHGKEMTDVAIIIMHDERAYVFSCDGDDDGIANAQATLDAAVGSIEWIKS